MSGIGSISGGNSAWMMQGMRQRPDAAQMAENLFSKLDTSGQGYIQKSDLQTAFDKIATASSPSSNATSSASTVDDLFAKLDTDSNGKVSKQEFTDVLSKLQKELEQQFQSNRMQMAMQAGGMGEMNGMPPPPPPGEGPSLSKDELSSALSQVGASDSRSSMMSNILSNFEAADANSDGKVSFQEAVAYQQSSGNSSNSAATTASDSSTGTISSSLSSNSEAKVMMQIMKLMQAYNIGNDQSQNASSLLSSLSISA